ncbi:hypothetical protein ACNI65_25740 [Roseateles sp. So40a]|uniref:hypothetical protein n=1 Tax=Roseateles sp. So40a TaxID=3400226 RepID=UPI003A89974B
MKTYDVRPDAREPQARSNARTAAQRSAATASSGDTPNARIPQLAQVIQRSARMAAQRQTLDALSAGSAPVQLERKHKSTKKTKKQRNEEKRRLAAVDRLNRGSPGAYDHMDPEVRANLLAIDEAQPRKTATRRNMASREQRLKEANLPSFVEVGAGTGSASTHLRDLAAAGHDPGSYMATDISRAGGKGKFLSDSRKAGIRSRGGVDANRLEEYFPEGSLKGIIGANAYGDRSQPGASYGLVRDTDTTGGTAWDDRFLRSAHKVLEPGGTARLMARSNFLADKAQDRSARLKRTNKYLSPTEADLGTAPQLGYDVSVSPAEQPDTAHFFRPDTHPGSRKELGAYNTEFAFTKRDDPGTLSIQQWLDDSGSDSGFSSDGEERDGDESDGDAELEAYLLRTQNWSIGI